jgi:hypothetical protein
MSFQYWATSLWIQTSAVLCRMLHMRSQRDRPGLFSSSWTVRTAAQPPPPQGLGRHAWSVPPSSCSNVWICHCCCVGTAEVGLGGQQWICWFLLLWKGRQVLGTLFCATGNEIYPIKIITQFVFDLCLMKLCCSMRESGPPLWSSVRVSGYRSRGPGFDSRPYQNFWEIGCLERGPLNLVRTIEKPLEWKSRGSGLENQN